MPAEGLVRTESLADDYYTFDRPSHSLTGRRFGNRYRLGDRLQVVVTRVDTFGESLTSAYWAAMKMMTPDDSKLAAARCKRRSRPSGRSPGRISAGSRGRSGRKTQNVARWPIF